MKRLCGWMFLYLTMLLCGCGRTEKVSTVSTDGSGSAQDILQLKAEAQLVLHCEEPSDCLALGYGSNACGGSSGFVVTSRWNDVGRLTGLAKGITLREKSENAANGASGLCEIVIPPGLACDKAFCQEQ